MYCMISYYGVALCVRYFGLINGAIIVSCCITFSVVCMIMCLHCIVFSVIGIVYYLMVAWCIVCVLCHCLCLLYVLCYYLWYIVYVLSCSLHKCCLIMILCMMCSVVDIIMNYMMLWVQHCSCCCLCYMVYCVLWGWYYSHYYYPNAYWIIDCWSAYFVALCCM